MNRRELLATLDKEGVRRDAYNLEGGYNDESLTLEQGEDHWSVYYCERGSKTGMKILATEDEACRYLLSELREDRTAHIDAPRMTRPKLFEILKKESVHQDGDRWIVVLPAPLNPAKRMEFASEKEALQYLWDRLDYLPDSEEQAKSRWR